MRARNQFVRAKRKRFFRVRQRSRATRIAAYIQLIGFLGGLLSWAQPTSIVFGMTASDILSAAMDTQNRIQTYEFSGTYINKDPEGVSNRFWFRQSGDLF